MILGDCAGCGGKVVDVGLHVPVVHTRTDGVVYVGPEMVLYHPACVARTEPT